MTISTFLVQGHAVGTIAYDSSRKIMVLNYSQPFSFVAKLDPPLMTETLTYMADSTWLLQGGAKHGVCRQFGVDGFHDTFSWARNPRLSEYVGQDVVQGRPCARWQMRTTKPNQTMVSLCADGDLPVQLQTTPPGNGTWGRQTIVFGPLSATGAAVDPAAFEKPPQCGALAPACNSTERVAELEAYVFHPGMSAADYDLAGQDVADLAGDAMFICSDRIQSNSSSFVDHNYSRISRYLLQVSPAYGQYALCNGYADTSPPGPVCFGGDEKLVGREAPVGVGEGGLRCAAESPLGWWYSLPKKGQCSPGRSPGQASHAADGACTWSVTRRLKTVEQACLLEKHRFVELCLADIAEGTGFHRSEAALKAAFHTEDLEEGGCPDIGGPGVGEAANSADTMLLV